MEKLKNMKGWTDKKYHYKIINEKEEIIAFFYDYLKNIETFLEFSKIKIKKIEKKGKNSFEVKVIKELEWII
jgi:hypothetical protein